MPQNQHPDLVDWRKRHGSKCEWCPLNGQPRKVGADGPVDAVHIGVSDAPSEDDADYGAVKGFKYGRILSDKSGYFWKLEYLKAAGLVELIQRPGKEWPAVELTGIQLTSVVMCVPPKVHQKRLDTPEGRAATLCCANSLRAWLRRRLAENPDVMVSPIGAGPLVALLRQKAGIDSHRGRLTQPTAEEWAAMLEDVPDDVIMRKVFRAKKPNHVWWDDFEKWLKSFLKFWRKCERGIAKDAKKAEDAALLAANEWLGSWTKLYKKQLAAVRKAERAAAKEAA